MPPPIDSWRRPPAVTGDGRPRRGRRRHAASPVDDRTLLESTGWRTTLDYRENHRRGADGVLRDVEPRWRGDAERSGVDGGVVVFSATGPTPAAVWRRLRVEAEASASKHARTPAERR